MFCRAAVAVDIGDGLDADARDACILAHLPHGGTPHAAAVRAWARTIDCAGFYLIASGAELAEFRDAVNAGSADICARLTADIDLSVDGKPLDWEPIGSPIYSGTFDGGGHTVSGYVVTKAAYYEAIKVYYAGFFARIGDESGSVKNLILRKDLSRVISAERSQIINVKFLQKQGATVFYGNPLLFSNSYRIKFQ